MSLSDHRPTTATIDLNSLAFNFRSVRNFIGRDTKYLAVVKADAYGHGAVECSRRLAAEGVDWFGVALPEEGVELRNAGIEQPILILGGFWPGQEHLLIDHWLTPVIFTVEQASLLNSAASARGVAVDYHVKIDTGMGRIGIRHEQVEEFATTLKMYTSIRLDGLMTHFAAAEDLGQSEFTERQIELFDAAAQVFIAEGFCPTFFDLANSPGAIAYPAAHRSMVRLGGVLYGLARDVLPRGIEVPELHPVLALTSKIAQTKRIPAGDSCGYGRTFVAKRDSLIGTIPIGYADGYPRSQSNKGQVIVNETLAPVVGRVSMDWTIIDITDVPDAAVGCEVSIIGKTRSFCIRAEDIAASAETISYEITCGIDNRVQRRFVG